MSKRKNYNNLVKGIRIVLAVLSITPLLGFFASLFTNPNTFVGSDLFIIYFTLICFTLPSLISKVVFKSSFLSLYSVLSFLIYPAIYLAALGVSLTGIVTINSSIYVFGVIALIAWHGLALKYLFNNDFDHIDDAFTGAVLSLIPFAIYLFIISFVRDYNSIISTDILVHKTVLNGMESLKTFSIMPSGYSNMFTDEGYPVVFYHTFLFFINNGFNLSFVKVAYYIDLIFTFIASVTMFKIFLKHFKSYGWALLASALTILSFENIAYSTHYFVPQTMAFWFFLQIISNNALKTKELIIAIPTLIITHLFMGTYFAGILIFKSLFSDRNFKLWKIKLKKERFIKILLILFGFSILLSFGGFSIETTFQSSTLKEIGIISNPAFFEKFITISNIFGLNIILIVAAVVFSIKNKLRWKNVSFALGAILIGLSMYFLAPTFAAKFFLGLGFFTMIILISFLQELEFNRRFYKYILTFVLILSFGINFIQQYNNNLPFLEQESGITSAVTQKDRELIEFWRENSPTCIVISDPQTQIELHALGEGDSVRGYYMTLESRRKLADFIRNPNEDSLVELYNLSEVSDKNSPLCIAITSRLNELIEYKYAWLDVIYNYKVDHTGELSKDDKAVKFLQDNNFEVIYSDNYSKVFQTR